MDNSGMLKTIAFLSAIVFISCAGTNTTTNNQTSVPPGNIVGEVGGDPVTFTELKDSFVSGSLSDDYTLAELQEFLPVYLDYKAKILAAEDAGYFENESIKDEYELYSKQAAYAFWMDKVIKPEFFDEYKQRYNLELKTSHVLIRLAPNASPADTLEAYNKLIEARDKYLAGTPMSELDAEYSSKDQGRSMGGDLPWFSVGAFVKPFEDAAYSLKDGEISMPFRTQFGFHIALLEKSRQRTPERNISHIFVRPGQTQYKIDSAYAALQRGESWAETVSSYSEDAPSVRNAGNIGWFTPWSRYDTAFVRHIMNMDTDLPYSEPYKSAYGFHIFKIDSVQNFNSQEEKDAFLMKQLEASPNFRESNSFVVNWLKEKYTTQSDNHVVGEMMGYFMGIDSTRFSEASLPSDLASAGVFGFAGEDFTGADYLDYLQHTQGAVLTKNYRRPWFNSFQETIVDQKITDLTVQEYPEFIDQVESYRKGLVVYQINDDSLWNAATVDSTILMDMYLENPDRYSFGTRYHYYLISSRTDSSLNSAKKFVLAGNSPDSIRAAGISVGVLTDSTESVPGEPFNTLSE